MSTRYWTVDRWTIEQAGDLWTMPCLLGVGTLEPGKVTVRITDDGQLVHPVTVGPASDLDEQHVYRVELVGPLVGWGDLDCIEAYRIVGAEALVPAVILEQVADWTGTELRTHEPGYLSLPNKLRAALRRAQPEDVPAVEWLRGSYASTLGRQAVEREGTSMDQLADAFLRGDADARARARELVHRASRDVLGRWGLQGGGS